MSIEVPINENPDICHGDGRVKKLKSSTIFHQVSKADADGIKVGDAGGMTDMEYPFPFDWDIHVAINRSF